MQRRHFLYAGAGLLASTLAGCGGGSEAPLRVRPDVLQLSGAERERYVQTLHAMKRLPSAYDPAVNAYDYFVQLHGRAFPSAQDPTHYNAHMSASFLPWHREFLLRFERELQRVSGDAQMALPYWDWQQQGSWRAIFTDDFLGGNGDAADRFIVKSGMFREGLWPMGAYFDETPDEFADSDGDGIADINPAPLSRRGLTRRFSFEGLDADSMQVIDDYMAREPRSRLLAYADYDAAPYMESMLTPLEHLENRQSWIEQSMRKYLELVLHNPVHAMIGGQMATGTSPNDPVFFLHHANVDRLWALWQDAHAGASYPSSAEDAHVGSGASLDLLSGDVRIDSVLDLAAHSGVRYAAG